MSGPVLQEVAAERATQDAKWGEQNHPDGTGSDLDKLVLHASRMAEAAARKGGVLSWHDILDEECSEAMAAAPNSAELRAELIQVAAVAVAWVECIDRRNAGGK